MKLLNIILQLILVSALAGVALMMQNKEAGVFFSDGALGIFVLCVPLCWVVVRFFKAVWFFLTLAFLALGFLGGYLSLELLDSSLSGYVIVLFTVFLFWGAAMVCSNEKMGLFFLSQLAMPLAGWVLIALLLDFALELFFFEQEIGLILLQIKISALLSGLVVGLVSQVLSLIMSKQSGVGLERYCLVGGGVVDEASVESASAPASSAVKETKVRPSVSPSATPAAAPAVARSPISAPKEAPPVSAPKAKPAVSVLDAKLEALCSTSTKKKGKAKKTEDAPSTPEEPVAPPVPTTTETGKIVSSVDFG